MSEIPPYQTAKVYISSNDAFVFFQYWDRASRCYKREKMRLGLRKLAPDVKENIYTRFCSMVNKEIDRRNKLGIYHQKGSLSKVSDKISIIEWAKKMHADQELGTELRNSVSGFYKSFQQFEELNPIYKNLEFDDISPDIVKRYIKMMSTVQDLAGKTINKYLWSFEKVASYARNQNGTTIEFSAKDYRVKQIKNETERFPPLTYEEKERAFSFFREKNKHVYLFLLHVYYTCIRPVELRRIKVKYIDLERRTIFIPWYKSKNGLSNFVQILEPLYQALLDFHIGKLDPEMYLFGDLCMPAAAEDPGHYATDVWARQRKNMNMPQNKQMYGLKHTFNVDYVENNKSKIDWEWLRRHNRHATVQQTQQYISGLTAYFLDETKYVILDFHRK